MKDEDAEKEASQHWSCLDALYRLFFSDTGKYGSTKVLKKDIYFFISERLSGRSGAVTSLADKDRILIGEKVDALLKIEPRLELKPSQNRLAWFRFGFLAQRHAVTLSNWFVKYFGRWRLRLSLTGRSHTVCDLGPGANQTPTGSINIPEGKFKGYTMDRFFHCAAEIKLFSSDIDWQLVRTDSVGAHKIKATSKTSSPKRSVKDTVGANSYIAIEKCISIAARDGRFTWIQANKIGGRYPTTVTRDELAELLKEKYASKLNCKKSVIKRALSDFVSRTNARR